VNGFSGLLEGLRFPVANGYMSVSALASEGQALGTVTIGAQFFSIVFFPSPHDADTVSNACYMEAVCR
jgi:hypothetical protein